MSEFVERLSGLLFEHGLNKKEFANEVGIKASCVTVYLQGKGLPTVESLVKIADYFNCSTDFLLGYEEENKLLKFKACPPFSEQILFLKERFVCSAYQIYNNTDVSKTCYYDWVRGKRKPTLENIIRLAKLFDCRVDFVLGREI